MWKQSPLLIFCVCVTSVLGQEISRKICSNNPSSSECQQLARTGEVACNYNFHNVDCLLNIQSNTSHLGRINGNQALLGANLLSENVVVLGEIRSRHTPSQTVVIVKSNIANDFINLKGKKFCHPGYTNDLTFPHFMLKEFEDKIIELESPACNDNITLLERHISTLSTFFGESCKPGPWSQNIKEHEKLQNRYSSLCALCGNSKCDVAYTSPFNDSLKCLLNNQADVAISTLREAQQFFRDSANARNYKYFCKDGTSSSNSVPCIWSSKLPDLLVAERTVASYMEKFLRSNLQSEINSTKTSTEPEGTAGDVLTRILSLTPGRKSITFLEQYSDYRSLKRYVADNENVTVPIPLNKKQCDRTLKWCTINDSEQEKCKWLSQASVNWGIQPQVECVQSADSNELSCLDDIKRGAADIVVASSDYAYVSFKKGLTSVAFPETDSRNLSVILAVKRNDNSIQTFQDMQGKRACIPRFGGIEHLTFIDTLRNKNLFDGQNCDYGQLLTDFVGNSCVPGVRSSLVRESSDSVDKDKLCAQCVPINSTRTSEYCNADAINKYYGDTGALDCLFDQKADFAIVTKPVSANDTDLRVICKNNTVSSVVGLNVDRECALAVLPTSEIVALINNTKIRDIKLALFEFERWFGQYLDKSFHLFDRFNDTTDLLFLDTTPGLDIDNEVANIEEYKNLLRKVKDCTVDIDNAATPIGITLGVLYCIVFAHIILNKLF